MNYPFTAKKSLRRLSLALIAALMLVSLTGCSLLPSGQTEAPTEPPTEIETEAPTAAPTAAPTEPPTEAPKENIAIVKEQLGMRNSPSVGARVKVELDAGEEVEVTRVEFIDPKTWAFVYYEPLGANGWIEVEQLDMSNVTLSTGSTDTPASSGTDVTTATTEATAATTPTTAPVVDKITGSSATTNANAKYGVVTASELNIRQSASQSADRVGFYTYGDRIAVLESSNGWGRTDKGWISLSYVYMDGDTGSKTASGTVTATQLNVRSGPGTNYEVVKSLTQGANVQVLEQITIGTTTWGYVSGGWASMEYINTGATGTVGGTTGTTTTGSAVITGTNVNIRAGAGTSYQTVGTKNMGDVVTILETATAEGYTWGRTDLGWICMNYVRMN